MGSSTAIRVSVDQSRDLITEPAPRTKINRDNSRRRHRRPSHEGDSEKGTLKEASNIRTGERTNGWKQRFIGLRFVDMNIMYLDR